MYELRVSVCLYIYIYIYIYVHIYVGTCIRIHMYNAYFRSLCVAANKSGFVTVVTNKSGFVTVVTKHRRATYYDVQHVQLLVSAHAHTNN